MARSFLARVIARRSKSLMVAVAMAWSVPVWADLVDDVDDLDSKKPKAAATQAPTSEPVKSPVAVPTSGASPSVTTPKATKPVTTPTAKPMGIPMGSKGSEAEEVHWWSNGLQLQKEAGIADLEDDVVVTKGDMRLESRKARIFFKPDSSEIIRVVATGDVRLQKHDASLNKMVKAQGDEAVFYNLEQRITVRGNARLWRGPDLMKGKQIGYDMKTGIVKVEQVEGIVQPGSKE